METNASARYFATSARGIEEITARELTDLGASGIEITHGGVFFNGNRELLYRANLWLRTATRVFFPLREFSSKSQEMLYDQARRVKWEQWLKLERTFAVSVTMAKDGQDQAIHHAGFAALKIKDAIVDQLRTKFGARPNVDPHSPDVRIHAHFSGGRCSLSLDSSGTSLHERGYRARGALAPVKETLAAAIIGHMGWDPATPLIDPMCGSGTFVLEAALKAMNVAPGLLRPRFAFESWPDFDAELWKKLTEEARAKVTRRPAEPIVGYDRDPRAIAAALENAKNAGLSRAVHFEKRELNNLQPVGTKPGMLILNPPYGERLGEVEELKGLYRQIGDLFKQRMRGWTGFIFTGNRELAKSVGLHAARKIPLFNGAIECRLLKYELY